MEPYPLSVRRRIIEMYQRGDSTEEIAEVFGYCVAGVRRIRQRYEETGSLEPRKTRTGPKPKLDADAQQRLIKAVEARPDATLAELRQVVGVKADLAVYCRLLKKLGLTRKKSRSTPLSSSGRM